MDPDKAQAQPIDRSVILLAPALVALSLWSLPHAVQAGDAGEFATVMLTGGIPHPSGYPWMRLLGLLSRGLWAIGLPPATAAALPPAVCGVAGWLLVHRCTARLGHGWLGAWIVLLCAAAPLSVVHVNDSEVWGPHLLFSSLFLHTVVHTQARPRAFLLGLTFGLAVSHHLTAVLLLPLAIGSALPHEFGRKPIWAVVRNGLIGIGGGLIGLLPYATLMMGRGGAWRWGDTQTLHGWAAHVLRRDFGTFSLSLHEEQVDAIDGIARALTSVSEVFTAELVPPGGVSPWAGLAVVIAALFGAGVGARKHAPVFSRGIALGWALSLLASAILFPAVGNIDPGSPFGAWILERFDLLTVLLLVVPLSLAIAELIAVIDARLEAARRVVMVAAAALALLLLVAQIGAVLQRGRPVEERGVELAAIDLVESPDPQGPAIPAAGPPVRAIVFGTDDHRSFPVLYVQSVLGAGVHTLYIDAELLAYPWYRSRLRERLPSLPDVDKPLALMGAIWLDPQLANVPIYLANVFSRPAAALEKIPEGVLWRVPPPRELPVRSAIWDPSMSSPERVVERHLAASARMRIRPDDFGGLDHPRGHPWSADLWFAYVEKARALGSWLRAIGRTEAIPAIDAALRARTGESLVGDSRASR